MIEELSNSGAIPALEMMLRFAGARQRIIASNIANVSTPDYRHQDVSVDGFRAKLREAVEARRAATGGMHGSLPMESGGEVLLGPAGQMTLVPSQPARGILFHDRNNRDLERLMQDQAENAAAYRVSVDLLRSRFESLRAAIAERA
jgi:flagellar basal-body rod protein FlgB